MRYSIRSLAMNALIEQPAFQTANGMPNADAIADAAYVIADAMIAERNKA